MCPRRGSDSRRGACFFDEGLVVIRAARWETNVPNIVSLRLRFAMKKMYSRTDMFS